ncbi:Wzz/FepE/Etk N-terminal domain-containing protein [Bacillus sp. DX1.1]|uniref:YveK family protein n=1 Tax=unclassified Bacillus (in: firmicutes) TaxID=185979 RepID=UPI0025701E8B|nr:MULTISPECIES: Wzz/FepE/Etk N-terminal domain-containing protein [unclassified Bacillus (in: firmicutes)]MDM5154202.1 Wzz/FepE/Etk N-terminal domain-containing protein [Bacillus sp. DX1.1]WJE83123.1 Wzz/FepE/Etk N-terminal domain-containing protein [Bacillus sp. DX3.1]
MEQKINLSFLAAILKRNVLQITATTLFFLSISLAYVFFITKPVYESSTQLIVNPSAQPNANVVYNEIQANLQLINTYTLVLKSSAILDIVRTNLQLNESTSTLQEKITIVNEKNTQIMSITVQDVNPKIAKSIASEVANVFLQHSQDKMNVKNIEILSEAKEPEFPVKPNKKNYVLASIIFGIVVGMGLAIVRNIYNDKIWFDEDVKNILQVPMITVIEEKNIDLSNTNRVQNLYSRNSTKMKKLEGDNHL